MIALDGIRLWRPNGFVLEATFSQEATVTGVFGPSGAGKTTLLHVIAGLQRPDKGVIRCGSRLLFDSDRGIDLAAHRRRIAVVFQDARLFPHRSVRGNLLFGRPGSTSKDEMEPMLQRVASLLEIETLLDRRTRLLSGGERQRVAIGRALLSQPEILLLDEPLASLDASRRGRILEHLRNVRDVLRTPMLYVSHDLSEILQLTDRLVLMDAGRTVAHASFHQLAMETSALDVLHDNGLTNVLCCRIDSHDAEAGMTTLSTSDGLATDADRLRLNARLRPMIEVGEKTRISLRPSDIALATRRIEGLSIRNQVQGRVVSIAEHGGRAIVRVDSSGVPLLVEVSLKTVREMQLAPGRDVWCLIKSNAISYL